MLTAAHTTGKPCHAILAIEDYKAEALQRWGTITVPVMLLWMDKEVELFEMHAIVSSHTATTTHTATTHYINIRRWPEFSNPPHSGSDHIKI